MQLCSLRLHLTKLDASTHSRAWPPYKLLLHIAHTGGSDVYSNLCATAACVGCGRFNCINYANSVAASVGNSQFVLPQSVPYNYLSAPIT